MIYHSDSTLRFPLDKFSRSEKWEGSNPYFSDRIRQKLDSAAQRTGGVHFSVGGQQSHCPQKERHGCWKTRWAALAAQLQVAVADVADVAAEQSLESPAAAQ